MSRIITRCTVDTRTVDGPFADAFKQALESIISISIKLIAIVIYTPLALITGVGVTWLGINWAELYLKAQLPVISTRLQAGRTLVRVYADGKPGIGFEAVTAELEDVYFSAIAGHLGNGTGSAALAA